MKKIIKAYNDTKIAIIQKLSQSDEGTLQETEFLDDGTIYCRIERLKEKFSSVNQEIEMLINYDKKDNYYTEKLRQLNTKKNEISLNLAFLASNNLNNLDTCEKITTGLNTDFKLCITALKYYKVGDEKSAFESFYEYFKNKSGVIDHYLINKIYGLLLYKYKQYKIALPLLRKSAEKRPEDVEIHRILKEIYLILSMKHEEKIEKNILEVLGA
ncbi:hypothetical protein [Clostridium carboxidivorans]|nr:hypothetical protein [Clostridium carboxidivorans]